MIVHRGAVVSGVITNAAFVTIERGAVVSGTIYCDSHDDQGGIISGRII